VFKYPASSLFFLSILNAVCNDLPSPLLIPESGEACRLYFDDKIRLPVVYPLYFLKAAGYSLSSEKSAFYMNASSLIQQYQLSLVFFMMVSPVMQV